MNFLEQADMSYARIESAGLYVPILSVECQYKRPLVFDEPFAVYPKITEFNGVKLDIGYRIVSRRTGEVCITGKSSQCFTDMNLKPVRTRNKYPEIYSVLSGYVNYEIQD